MFLLCEEVVCTIHYKINKITVIAYKVKFKNDNQTKTVKMAL